jgi:uncharacterized repeat protein (TIGR03803 family)
MKFEKTKRLFGVTAMVLILGLGYPSIGWTGYSILHNFEGPPTDGRSPSGSLAQDSTYLYGMTSQGGYAPDYTGGYGALFRVNKDGTNYTILHSFGDGSVVNDGLGPEVDLILSGSTLYGVTTAGGSNGGGTIFKINTDGSGYTTLHSFGGYNDDGHFYYEHMPRSLTLSGSTLYGMTQEGGSSAKGVIFRVNTDGGGYTILHTFGDGTVPNDGAFPMGNLTLSGPALYGMTPQGGINLGVIFKINTDGCGYSILHWFHDETVANDGAFPYGGLTLSGSALYGMTLYGGYGGGTIFKINTDGSDYAILHKFGDGTVSNDVGGPLGNLTLSGSTLYGMTANIANGGLGVIFKVNTDGAGYTILHLFHDGTVANDGTFPCGSLAVSGSTLYGMTAGGGPPRSDTTYGYGIIFSLTIDPPPWTLYDDFNSGLIDPEKWIGSDSGSLLRERAMLISSKRLNLLERSYGSLDSNEGASAADVKLTFANSPKVMGIKALVKPTAFEVSGCSANTTCTSADASLLGYFFNTNPQGNGSRKNDVFASVGVVRDSKSKDAENTGTIAAKVGQCQDDACGTVTYLYSKTLGKLTKGSSAVLSVEWDAANHKFLFKRDSKSLNYSYNPTTYPDESPPAYNNKSLAVSSAVANCQSSPRPTAFMNTFFDNVYIKALTP